MTVLDANVLVYAHNADAPQHRDVTTWLKALFERPDLIGLPWPSVWAFLRIATNARLWPSPKPVREAFANIRWWLAQPGIVPIHPGPRHAEILERLIAECQATGPLVSDAVIAALALENGATVASTDRDFSRFSGLRWVNPLG
jgi:uncharacterized protein